MKRYRLWTMGLVGLIGLLTTSLPAVAHPLDEYVQNTYIDLAPGVLVAPQVVELIDADEDGAFSEAEGEAYAGAVPRDVALEVDDEPQPLTLVDSRFPSPLDMSAGGSEEATVITITILRSKSLNPATS